MPQRISKTTVFLNADKTKAVSEDSPDAAFLFVRAGSAVNESEAARLEKNGVTLNLKTEDTVDFDARAAHEAEHGTNETRAALEAKSQRAPAEDKAVRRAPADKGA